MLKVVDMLLTVLLLVILLGAAPLLSINLKNSSQVLGWLLCIPIFALLLVGGAPPLLPSGSVWGFLVPPQGRRRQLMPTHEAHYCQTHFDSCVFGLRAVGEFRFPLRHHSDVNEQCGGGADT